MWYFFQALQFTYAWSDDAASIYTLILDTESDNVVNKLRVMRDSVNFNMIKEMQESIMVAKNRSYFLFSAFWWYNYHLKDIMQSP